MNESAACEMLLHKDGLQMPLGAQYSRCWWHLHGHAAPGNNRSLYSLHELAPSSAFFYSERIT